MPKVDLTITISVVIAVCAIISPIITTLLNNRHAYKIKKMDMKSEAEKASYFYKRGIYESYLKYTGRCIAHANADALNQYGEVHALALMYFPDEFHDELIKINCFIQKNEYHNAATTLNTLAPKLHNILQSM